MKVLLETRFMCENCREIAQAMYVPYVADTGGLRMIGSPVPFEIRFEVRAGYSYKRDFRCDWTRVVEWPHGMVRKPERRDDGAIVVTVGAGAPQREYFVCVDCSKKLVPTPRP